MKHYFLFSLLLIIAISINSCSIGSIDLNDHPSGTFTVNLVDGSTNQPIPNIDGASWGVEFIHDSALNTSNFGNSAKLSNGKLTINMAQSKANVRAIRLYAPLSSDLDPNSAFSKKYYSQGNLYLSLSAGLEQTRVYYTKATIKCIVNVAKPENVGKRFYIRLIPPSNQDVVISNDTYIFSPLIFGQQIYYINAIGNYKNKLEWSINESLPNTTIEIFCNEGETKDLIINL